MIHYSKVFHISNNVISPFNGDVTQERYICGSLYLQCLPENLLYFCFQSCLLAIITIVTLKVRCLIRPVVGMHTIIEQTVLDIVLDIK